MTVALTEAERIELANLEARQQMLMSKDWLSPAERAQFDNITERVDHLRSRDDSNADNGINNFSGDNASPNTITPPPSPEHPADPNLVGDIPVSPTSDLPYTGPGPDLTNPIEQAPPVPGQTNFLPLTGNPVYDDTIKAVDAALTNINDTAFKLNPENLWHYDSATLGGPTGPNTISDLGPCSDAFKGVTGDALTNFQDLESAINSGSDGTWMKRMREMYAPLLKAANDGVGDGGPAQESLALLEESGGGIRGVFDSFHNAIRSSRDAIAGLYGTDEEGNRYLDTTRALTIDPSIVSDAQGRITSLDEASAKMGTSLDDWNIPVRANVTSGEAGYTPESSGGSTLPSSGGGGGSLPSAGSGGGGLPSSGDATGVSEATPTAQQTQMPSTGMQSPQMPSMPSMPQMGMPQGLMDSLSNIGQQDEPKPAGGTELTADDSAAEKKGPSLTDPAGGSGRATPASATDPSSAAVHAAAANTVPKPGDPVRPGALGADGKPLDKDGDGLMDRDAVAPTKENADPDGDGIRNQFDIQIDTGERSVTVTMSDPRIAEMMTRLADASPENPLPILDAAEQSGVEMENFGSKIDVLAIQPGDVVTGTDNGMYLGNGMVLCEDGDIKGLVEVMDRDKSVETPAVYRMELPELPSSGEVLPEQAEELANADAAQAQQEAGNAGAVEPEITPAPEPEAEAPAESAPAAPTPAQAAPADPADDTEQSPDAMYGMSGDTGGIETVEYQGEALG